MSVTGRRGANEIASAAYAASRRTAVDLTNPDHAAGLTSLLSRVYSKPVELNLIKLRKPHLDADILASVVRQRLSDRTNTARRVIRDAAWKAQLPNARTVTAMKQAKVKSPTSLSERIVRRSSAFARHRTPTSVILQRLTLSQVSAVRVQARGRLTKRMTANRSTNKFARRGANAKRGDVVLRGVRKGFVKVSQRSGKRRIGAFGVRIDLAHS